jgi:hypothetical protein
MSAQPVRHAGPLGDQVLAVTDQQSHLSRGEVVPGLSSPGVSRPDRSFAKPATDLADSDRRVVSLWASTQPRRQAMGPPLDPTRVLGGPS